MKLKVSLRSQATYRHYFTDTVSDLLGVPNSCGYATVTKGTNSLDWLTLDSTNIADGYFDVIVQMDADASWSLLGNNYQQILLQIPGSASAYR